MGHRPAVGVPTERPSLGRSGPFDYVLHDQRQSLRRCLIEVETAGHSGGGRPGSRLWRQTRGMTGCLASPDLWSGMGRSTTSASRHGNSSRSWVDWLVLDPPEGKTSPAIFARGTAPLALEGPVVVIRLHDSTRTFGAALQLGAPPQLSSEVMKSDDDTPSFPPTAKRPPAGPHRGDGTGPRPPPAREPAASGLAGAVDQRTSRHCLMDRCFATGATTPGPSSGPTPDLALTELLRPPRQEDP